MGPEKVEAKSKPPPIHPPIWFINKLMNAKFSELTDLDTLKKLETYHQGLFKDVEGDELTLLDSDGEEVNEEHEELPETIKECKRVKGAIEYAQ